jgi:recombination protein RecA
MAKDNHTSAGQASSALNEVLGALNKVSGYDVQNRFTGDMPPVISTGVMAIDDLTNIGGLPYGQVVQVYGEPSQFKTGFALHMVAQVQKDKPEGVVLYFDTEGSYNHVRAQQHGVDTSKVVLLQGNVMEEKFIQAIEALKTGRVVGIFFDSWGAFIEGAAVMGEDNFKKDKEGFKSGRQPGTQSRLTTQFLQTCNKYLLEDKIFFMIVDQNRSKIGVLYGDPNKRTGGMYKAYAVVMEFRVRVVESVKSDPTGGADGLKVAFSFTKNKYGPIGSTSEKDHPTFWFGDEARKMGDAQELMNRLVRHEIIIQNGGWYSFSIRGEVINKWNGKNLVAKSIMEDAKLRAKLESMLKTREKLSGSSSNVPPESAPESDDSEVSAE